MRDGDISCLFAFWLKLCYLHSVENDGDLNSLPQLPTFPFGLVSPSASHSAFIEYFEIDSGIYKAVAYFSKKQNSPKKHLKKAIEEMEEVEKNDWLFQVLEGELSSVIKMRKKILEKVYIGAAFKIDFQSILLQMNENV